MNTYIVQKGDTLQSIAKNILGDEKLTPYLASINNIPAQNAGIVGGFFYSIAPGQRLIVDVPEVSATLETSKYNYTPYVIGGLLLAGTVWYVTK